jgi:threonine dehydratase
MIHPMRATEQARLRNDVNRRAPDIDDIVAAAGRIAKYIVHTPLVPSPTLSQLVGGEIWLKLETRQPTGSFKIRGAINAIARLRDARPDIESVTTASAGNHGIALAKAAAEFGMTVKVYVPFTVPTVKREALLRHGALVVEAPSYDEAERRAHEEAALGEVTFISAYSHSDVIAGAGTVALEMIAQQPGLDTFVVPLGGGGLLSGTAIVARARLHDAMLIGAEAAASPVFTAALAAGRPVTVPVRETLADGLAGNLDPSSQTFRIVRDLVDRVVKVQESAIALAMRDLKTHDDLTVEGAAATAVGALTSCGLNLSGRRIGVILSGKNK